MKKMRGRVCMAAAAMALAGCAAVTDFMPARPAADNNGAIIVPERTIPYRCDDGRSVDVTLVGPERARLKISGAVAELAAVRAASGARFESADGGIVFWSKGNEALIETRGRGGARGVSMNCVVAE